MLYGRLEASISGSGQTRVVGRCSFRVRVTDNYNYNLVQVVNGVYAVLYNLQLIVAVLYCTVVRCRTEFSYVYICMGLCYR